MDTVCRDNLKIADIAREIRLKVYASSKNPWNGVAKGDIYYRRIYTTLGRMKRAVKAGKLKHLVDNADPKQFRSKSVQPGARGRKPLSPTQKVR